MTIRRGSLVLTIFLALPQLAQAGKPVIQLDFKLQSKTLSNLLKKDGTDRTSSVAAAVLAEFQERAVAYFPFVDWSPTPTKGIAGYLRVQVAEQPVSQAPSNYYLQYWNGETSTQIGIGLTKAFIPSGDAHQPASADALTQRIKLQLDQDLDAAASGDLVNLFLCKIAVVKAPPAQPELSIIDDGVLKLPMMWEALLADGDISLLKVDLWSQKPDHPDLSEGILILRALRKCSCDARSVLAVVDSFYYPGLVLRSGEWSKEASDVLAPARLKTLEVTVQKYKKMAEKKKPSEAEVTSK